MFESGVQNLPGEFCGRQTMMIAQQAGHPRVSFAPTLQALQHALFDIVQSGDLVLTLGAGNIFRTGEALLEQLARTTATKSL